MAVEYIMYSMFYLSFSVKTDYDDVEFLGGIKFVSVRKLDKNLSKGFFNLFPGHS